MTADVLHTELKERVSYDSLELPFYIRRAVFSSYCPALRHACHWHEDIEFLYTIRRIAYRVDE